MKILNKIVEFIESLISKVRKPVHLEVPETSEKPVEVPETSEKKVETDVGIAFMMMNLSKYWNRRWSKDQSSLHKNPQASVQYPWYPPEGPLS